jgi:1,4-alpha-glucan branching enzyme
MAIRDKNNNVGKRKPMRKEGQHSRGKAVEIRFFIPEAREVWLAGEFNAWDPKSCAMEREGEGIWKTSRMLLPGCYEFKLFADQSWVEDLPEAEAVLNPFGTRNFILRVA